MLPALIILGVVHYTLSSQYFMRNQPWNPQLSRCTYEQNEINVNPFKNFLHQQLRESMRTRLATGRGLAKGNVSKKNIGEDNETELNLPEVKFPYHPNSVLHKTYIKPDTNESKKIKQNKIEEEANISTFDDNLLDIGWKHCTAKNRNAYICSDIDIRCEVWAPLGSNITWYKNGEVQRKHVHHEFESQELVSVDDIPHDVVLYEHSARAKYEFHLMSLHYIDCFSENDAGRYEFQVSTPNGRVHSRYFNIKSLGFHPTYFAKCWQCRSKKTYEPKVADFTKTTIAKAGQDIYLPCRPNFLSNISVFWKKVNRNTLEEIDIDPQRFSITDEGDLKISNVTLWDQGMYSCELEHYSLDIIYDEITTFVKVLE